MADETEEESTGLSPLCLCFLLRVSVVVPCGASVVVEALEAVEEVGC
jgi:hypothetical protein